MLIYIFYAKSRMSNSINNNPCAWMFIKLQSEGLQNYDIMNVNVHVQSFQLIQSLFIYLMFYSKLCCLYWYTVHFI